MSTDSKLQKQLYKEYDFGIVVCVGKIQLEGPYSLIYKYGVLVLHKSSDRFSVTLYNSSTDKLFLPYARYLYTVKSEKMIPPGYQVDHIDDDYKNEHPDNLQLLTGEDNYKKYRKHYTKNIQEKYYTELTCNNCKKKFIKQKGRVLKENFANQYCCKECETEYRNKDKVELKCATCRKAFLCNKQTYLHNKSRHQQNFWCSDSCCLQYKNFDLFRMIDKDYFTYLLLHSGRKNVSKYFKVNKQTVTKWKTKLEIPSDIMTEQRPHRLKQLSIALSNLSVDRLDRNVILKLLADGYILSDISTHFNMDVEIIHTIAISQIERNELSYTAKLINALFLEGVSLTCVASKLNVPIISVKLAIQKYNITNQHNPIRPPILELRNLLMKHVSPAKISELYGVKRDEVLRWVNYTV